MKFLVIGLGSMGKRRVRNLQKLGEQEIIGFDVRKDRANEATRLYSTRTFTSFAAAMKEEPNVLIISCPPDKHLRYARYAADHDLDFFSEVNTERPEKLASLITRLRGKKIVAAPSCTMRYHPAVAAIKKLVDSGSFGKPMILTYHSGENLEDWHPWEKVTDYYVGKKETGGGRDQIMFELEWIRWLLGDMLSVRALTSKLSGTKADIHDTYDLILETRKGSVANVLVDVIQRPPNRILRMVCEKGVIHWDWMTHVVRAFRVSDGKWEEIPESPGYKGYIVEEMYEQEMLRFLRAVKKKERYPITFEDELELLNITFAAEKSSSTGRQVRLQ